MFSLLLIALLQLQPMQMLREDPDRAGVNTHPYEFGEVQTTPAPKGYEPVYISHYGRHGSRVNWGLSNYTYVIDILEKADSAGILTPEGEEGGRSSSRSKRASDPPWRERAPDDSRKDV